jgi:tetratricopeptide (TPR) repeat protein
VNPGQPANVAATNPASYDYSQPVNLAATANVPMPADPSINSVALAGQAFQGGDYAGAVQLTQQALGQSPNDVNLLQLLALGQFAQGNYEQAAAPLYAVLAVAPGWDWTTLIGHYADASVYTSQLRGLEAFVKANPQSARSRLVEAYQYICQGQGQAAIKPLKAILAIQPNDSVSAQLLDTLQPQAAPGLAQPPDPSKLPGVWIAQAAQNAKVTLTISDDANFSWAFAAPGKPPMTITGTYALANGVLSLYGKDAPGGPLAGKVAAPDDTHMSFKAIGAPASDPGLQFVR